MAKGTIRIIREPTPVSSGEIGGTSSQASGPPVSSVRPPSPSPNSGSSPTPRRRQSEDKRSSLRIEDRSGNQSSEVSDPKSNKRTPAPTGATTPVSSTRYRPKHRYLGSDEAKSTAQFYLSAAEMVGVTVAGPLGEMTDFERGMLTPPMQRVLQRIPLAALERSNIVLDAAFLIIGGAVYFNRISGGVRFPTRSQTKGVQEDTRAPVAAPTETTVDNTKPGDVDGIAVPVPSIIAQHMNGSI